MSANDPALRSFVEVAADSHFPIQNLPYGVFSTQQDERRRIGVAIGDFILDLAVLEEGGLLTIEGAVAGVFNKPSLNPFMGFGPDVWSATRARISQLLSADEPLLRDNDALRKVALVPLSDATMHLPFHVASFSDFYSSLQHASNAGMILR